MKILITGITGFTGSHLADLLLSQGCTVCGTLFDKSETANVKHILDKIRLFECDICDSLRIEEIIRETSPDYIFHFAAHTSRLATKEDVQAAFKTNVFGIFNLLSAERRAGIDSVTLVPGSSAEFGLVEENEIPITENNPYRPVNPYGVSKIAQGMTAYQYYLTYGMNIIRTHTFNYTGPRQGEDFVCSAFSKQIAQIEKGIIPPVIQVGNLDTLRDFTDVRDVVKAYWLAVERAEPGQLYNICSGRAYSIRQVLENLLNLTDAKIEVRQEPKKMQPSDVPLQVGDFSKFRKLTGWQPEIPIEETLEELLDYWRQSIDIRV